MLTLKEVLADAADSPGFEGVSNVHVNSRGAEGQTPLHWMAILGDHDAIQLLLQADAELNAQDALGNTALHKAVTSRQHTAVRALLAAGANADTKNNEGISPRRTAEMDGYRPNIELLCQPAP